jgi:hypothetical protein
MRDFIEYERLEAKLVDARVTHTDANAPPISDCPACGCVTRIPLWNDGSSCDGCAQLIREVRVARRRELPSDDETVERIHEQQLAAANLGQPD